MLSKNIRLKSLESLGNNQRKNLVTLPQIRLFLIFSWIKFGPWLGLKPILELTCMFEGPIVHPR